MKIHTPLIGLTKAGIVKLGAELGVDFSLTHSCYDPDPAGRACGACDSCVLRRKGFEEAGVGDPAAPRRSLKIFFWFKAEGRSSAGLLVLFGPAGAICGARGVARPILPCIPK